MIAKNKKGYKKTKLGWIPIDWEEKKFSEIALIKVGRDLNEESYSQVKTKTHIYPVYSNTVDNWGFYGFYDFWNAYYAGYYLKKLLPNIRDFLSLLLLGGWGVVFCFF